MLHPKTIIEMYFTWDQNHFLQNSLIRINIKKTGLTITKPKSLVRQIASQPDHSHKAGAAHGHHSEDDFMPQKQIHWQQE